MYNMEISIGSYSFRLEILLLIVVVFWIMFGHVLCGCSRVGLVEGLTVAKKIKESFVGSNNMGSGPEFAEAQNSGYIMNPSTWSMPTLTYSPGTTPDAGVKAIWDRPKQPIPLPKDELDMFATTDFKPECCPNAYSNSSGCACMTVDQSNFLHQRGGNNVPYSMY
jgi:hypothetical protein